MTLLKSGSTQATTNGTVESTFASIAETDDKYVLCRVYRRMISDGDFDRSAKYLERKYPEIADNRVFVKWRRGVKPRSWACYSASIDPDCVPENIQLIMDRYDISREIAKRAIQIARPADYNLIDDEDTEEDTGWPPPRRNPSPISPWLAGWKR